MTSKELETYISNTPKGRYCSACGKPLLRKVGSDGYSPLTGEPLYKLTDECPEYKGGLLSLFQWRFHDSEASPYVVID